MSYEIRLNRERRLVVIVHHQEFEHTIGSKVLPEMMNVLAFKQWSNVLVDFREVPGTDLIDFEHYIFSKNLHQTMPRGIRMGILVSEESKIPEENIFAAESRMDMRVFDCEGDALNWFE